jgi:hypothetical protein
MTDLEILIDKIHKYHRPSDINDLCLKILKRTVYFFVIDDGSFSSLTEIVWTSKERPMLIRLAHTRPSPAKTSRKRRVIFSHVARLAWSLLHLPPCVHQAFGFYPLLVPGAGCSRSDQ